ncbi:MAG: hypothetical protein ACE37B_14890 [Ilumatobacter sp.]|uniref:hypothetical protein n=1 Tax=Ilumatobacter sp. TaxID=1967498 RepID=UPI0039191516
MEAENIFDLHPKGVRFREPSAEEARDTVNAVCDNFGLIRPTELHVEEAAPVARRTGRSQNYNQYTRFVKWCAGRAETAGNFLVDHLGFTALRLTALATALAAISSALVLLGEFGWATAALLAAGGFEAVDAVAARKSVFDRRDVFIDYLSDRAADVMLFGAFCVYMVDQSRTAAALSAVVLLLSLLSSYGRAQAEALRFRSQSRFGRLERVVGLVLLFGGVGVLEAITAGSSSTFAIWVLSGLAALSLTTLMERVSSVIRSHDYLTLDTAGSWDDDHDLPRLLLGMIESNEKLTVIETAEGHQEIGQLIHIRRDPTGRALVTLESGVTYKSLRKRLRAS